MNTCTFTDNMLLLVYSRGVVHGTRVYVIKKFIFYFFLHVLFYCTFYFLVLVSSFGQESILFFEYILKYFTLQLTVVLTSPNLSSTLGWYPVPA